MKKRALRKDFYMEIKKSLNRFVSIMLIVALGVAFYSGIQSAAPDMRYSGDAYFDEHKLMDLKVVGTLGLTERDVEALKSVEGISKAEPGYMTDVLCGEETQQVLHLESISPTLNQLTPSEGRLPEKSGECFVDIEFLDKGGYEIGDKIVFYRENEEDLILKRDTFTIVGAGSSPLYISFNRGNTTLGTGEIAGAGYLLAEDFDSEVYTQIYMEVNGARNLTAYTDAYDTLIEKVMDRVEAIEGAQCEIRYQEVMDDANEELSDAKKELEDAKIEAESELADAKKELEDGEKELADGKKDLEDAKKDLADGEKELADGEKELEDNKNLLAEKERELADGKAKLADGWAKLQSGKNELAANEKKFNKEYSSGMKKIESGEKELEAAKKKIEDGWQQYNAGLKEYVSSKAQYEAGETAYAQGLAQLQEQEAAWPQQKAGLEAQKAELEQAQQQLEAGIGAAQAQLSSALEGRAGAESAAAAAASQVSALQSQAAEIQQEIDGLNGQIEQETDETVKNELLGQRDGRQAELDEINGIHLPAAQAAQAEAEGMLAELDTQIAALESGINEYTQNLQAAADGISQIVNGISQGETAMSQAREQLQASRTELDGAKAQLEAAPQTLEASKKELEAGEKEITKNEKELAAGRTKLENAKKQIEDAKKTIAANEQTLNTSQAQITSGEQQIADAKQQIADGEKEIADAKKEIADGKKEIADGEKEIEENEKKLEDGWKEYEDGVKEYEEEIADAQAEITDAEEEIAQIKKPEWMISDRSSLPENIGYGENADRMRSLGQVFPVMFFLVAALISLTTMTRMVEEERTQIGTMKALGYGKAAIASKYLCYALIATLCGSVAGILIGEKFLPFVIVTAYRIMYHHMPNLVLPYNLKFALIATGAALFSTMFATLSACYKELASTPAVLMRPPAPKEGKRVLLERLPFFWKHLSFSWKSTVRNLFRYKKRFFMTIFGIGGCMALMLVGYGLRDSIMDVANLQFTELQIYDGMVIVDSDAGDKEQEELVQTVAKDVRIESSTQVLLQKDEVHNGKKMWNIYLMVPEDVESISNFVNFRNRESREEIYELTDEGAIITEKIASLMGVKAGDTILVENEDYGTAEIPVAAVTENYMSHYLYLTPALYEKCFGVKAEMNEVLFRLNEENKEELTKVGENFLSQEGALSISYTSTIMAQINDMLSALDTVMIVLIISAGLLAFVVLYNLNNININERKRELATIKVLGFYDGEVSAYVYRENILITIIGIGAGVVLGIILHRFVITTVEVDACMFGRNINLPSFLTASAFTAGFSVFVNVVMHFKLKKIDMVESLKSVE